MSVRLAELAAAVFDLDGTLVDQKSAASSAVIPWAAELGITDTEVPARWAEIADRHYRRYQRREISFEGQRRERVREFVDADLTDAEASRIFSGYLARYEAGWRLFDDAIPALRRARAAGLAVAVLTNGDRTQQWQKAVRFGLEGEIDAMVCSSELPAGKPDRRAFEAISERIGVRPESAVMIGDSPGTDIRGALDSGMAAVLLDREHRHPASAALRVGSLDEIEFIPSAVRAGQRTLRAPGR